MAFSMGSSSSMGRVLYPHLPPTGGLVSSLRYFSVGGLDGRRFQYHHIQLELDCIGLKFWDITCLCVGIYRARASYYAHGSKWK